MSCISANIDQRSFNDTSNKIKDQLQSLRAAQPVGNLIFEIVYGKSIYNTVNVKL